MTGQQAKYIFHSQIMHLIYCVIYIFPSDLHVTHKVIKHSETTTKQRTFSREATMGQRFS